MSSYLKAEIGVEVEVGGCMENMLKLKNLGQPFLKLAELFC